MRTAALGAGCDGEALAHTDTSPPLTATAADVVGARSTGRPWHRKPWPPSPEGQSPNQYDSHPFAHWGSIHRRKPVMVCGGLVGRYSGQLSGQVFAVPGGVWEPCEPDVQSRPTLGRLRAFSAFLFPPFLWRSKEKGVGVRG